MDEEVALLTLSSARKSGGAGVCKDCLKWKCIGPWHILLEWLWVSGDCGIARIQLPSQFWCHWGWWGATEEMKRCTKMCWLPPAQEATWRCPGLAKGPRNPGEVMCVRVPTPSTMSLCSLPPCLSPISSICELWRASRGQPQHLLLLRR